jgi:putative transposase
MIDFRGSHFEKEIILWGVRWYVAYPISYRQLEEMMNERGVTVDHSTLNRWVIKDYETKPSICLMLKR